MIDAVGREAIKAEKIRRVDEALNFGLELARQTRRGDGNTTLGYAGQVEEASEMIGQLLKVLRDLGELTEDQKKGLKLIYDWEDGI